MTRKTETKDKWERNKREREREKPNWNETKSKWCDPTAESNEKNAKWQSHCNNNHAQSNNKKTHEKQNWNLNGMQCQTKQNQNQTKKNLNISKLVENEWICGTAAKKNRPISLELTIICRCFKCQCGSKVPYPIQRMEPKNAAPERSQTESHKFYRQIALSFAEYGSVPGQQSPQPPS